MKFRNILVVVCSMASIALAQDERFEAATRRLAEKQQGRTRAPTTAASVPLKKNPTPGKEVAKVWRAKPDAPQVVRDWLAQVPKKRDIEIAEINRSIVESSDALRGEEAELKRIMRRRVEQVTVRDTLGGYQSKDSASDVARRRREIQAQQAVISKQKIQIAIMRKQQQKLTEDAVNLPLPDFQETNGLFGKLTGGVRIDNVIDGNSFVASYNGTSYLIEDHDTANLAANQRVELSSPVIASQAPRGRALQGLPSRLTVLKPFAWADHFEIVEGDGSLKAAGDQKTNGDNGSAVRTANEGVRRGALGEILEDKSQVAPIQPSSSVGASDDTDTEEKLRPDPLLGNSQRPARAAAPTTRLSAADVARRIRVVYVIDASGSMIDKFASVTRGIQTAVAKLTPGTPFNVLVIAGRQVQSFQPAPVAVSAKMVGELESFLNDLVTSGTSDLMPAIESAIKQGANQIWLVTDGDTPDNDEFRKKLRRINSGPRAHINTLMARAPGDDAEGSFLTFLQAVAAENGGKCYDIIGVEIASDPSATLRRPSDPGGNSRRTATPPERATPPVRLFDVDQ